jgi:anti-sigma factor RsiW
MACETLEPKILQYVEHELPEAERLRVETHLATCTACRDFAQRLRQLDARLARAVKPPALSPAFNQKLRQRIQNTVVLSPFEIAERKRQLQAEYEAGLARLRIFSVSRRGAFGWLTYFSMVTLAGFSVWRLLPSASELFAPVAQFRLNPNLVLALVVSAVFVGFGLAAAAMPARFRRLLAGVGR